MEDPLPPFYTESHMAVVLEATRRTLARRDEIGGMRFTYEPPVLRHFMAHFTPIPVGELRRAQEGRPA